MSSRYLRLSFQLETDRPGSGCADHADLLTAALWERGTLGVELCDATRSLVAYFPREAMLEEVAWELYGGRLVANEPFAEEDWLAGYRLGARPIAVGRQLLVEPGEPSSPDAAEPERLDGRWRLRLPARTAFGTGSHASTRLAVEWMDDLELAGWDVLDVGFGSGILSFVAQLAGAARVVGVEVDSQAALVAAQNRDLNGLFPQLVAGGVDALSAAARFDLALVNVLPERVAADLGTIARLVGPSGRAIFSGILTSEARPVLERLLGAGFEPRGRRTHEEWSAFLMTRKAAA